MSFSNGNNSSSNTAISQKMAISSLLANATSSGVTSAFTNLLQYYQSELNKITTASGFISSPSPNLNDLTCAMQLLNEYRITQIFVDSLFQSINDSLQNGVRLFWNNLQPLVRKWKKSDISKEFDNIEEINNEANDIDEMSITGKEWVWEYWSTQVKALAQTVVGINKIIDNLNLIISPLSSSPSSTLTCTSLTERYYFLFHNLFDENKPDDFSLLSSWVLSCCFDCICNIRQLDKKISSFSTERASSAIQALHFIGFFPVDGIQSSVWSNDDVNSFLFALIDRQIAEKYSYASISGQEQRSNESYIQQLISWMKSDLLTFAKLLFSNQPIHSVQSDQPASFVLFSNRLIYHAYQEFTNMRIHELFDLIMDYPDSREALLDLSFSLQQTPLHSLLITTLATSFRTRLLRPVASTHVLLNAYIQTISSLRILDPSGLLLEQVSTGLRTYLSNRSDCVRSVMQMVMGKEEEEEEEENEESNEMSRESKDGNDLSRELEAEPEKDANQSDAENEGEENKTNNSNINHETMIKRVINNDKDGDLFSLNRSSSYSHPYTALPPSKQSSQSNSASSLPSTSFLQSISNWYPDSLTGHPTLTNRSGRHADVLTLLFSLTSTSVALEEYRLLLSHRLLRKRGYSRESEVMRNERMKVRVGEEEMSTCEVMVRDIENSKRIQTRIQKEIQDNTITEFVKQHKAAVNKQKNSSSQQKSKHLPKTSSAEEYTLARSLCSSFELLLLSAEFWPELNSSTLNYYPIRYSVLTEMYRFYFHKAKAPRILNFLPMLGTVTLDIILTDRTISVTVPPLYVTLLALLENTGRATLKEIQSLSGLGDEGTIEFIRNKMSFWISKNIVRERKEQKSGEFEYLVIETLEERDNYDNDEKMASHDGFQDSPDMEDSGGMTSNESSSIPHRRALLEFYIGQTLTTFTSGLSVDRLHGYLGVFRMPDFVYDCTPSELLDILHRMEREGKVYTGHDGLYKKGRALEKE